MTFWRPNVYWTDELRWYERISVATWWLGKVAFAASILAVTGMAAAALYAPIQGVSNNGLLASGAGVLLGGIVAMTGARLMLELAVRNADRGG